MKRVEVWLSSAAKPGRGAWAWASTDNGFGNGVEDGATGHRMELLSAVQALRATKGDVKILAASGTLVETGRTWLHDWRSKGWRKKGGIASLDLVQELSTLMNGRTVEWELIGSDDARIEAVKDRARATLEAAGPLPKALPAAEKSRGEVAATKATVLVYTDGGCRGNPGVGGWGALMVHVATDKARAMRGGAAATTNNRMEMSGAIEALLAIAPGPTIEIRTDSKYLVDMCTKWMAGWKRRGWKRGSDQPGEIKNLDLVKQLDELIGKQKVSWTWVRGHNGEPGNEFADALTNAAMDEAAKGRDGRSDERFERSPIAIAGARR